VSLFEESRPPQPLAERMRPASLGEVLGQETAKTLLNAYIERGDMPSVVFFGPPGSGKTTLSRLMAALLGWEGRALNAASASVKDIRVQAKEARDIWKQLERRTLLFIDEIHRLNKNQQDVLLPIVESGTLTLAGSTTENPFFALNQALRSRVQLIKIEPLPPAIILKGLRSAAVALEATIEPEAAQWLADRVGGDLRLAYTALESAALLAGAGQRPITAEDAALCLSQTQLSGDRKGDSHYDLASAYQKSLRGSDPDAAIYYLARFLETGEDPRFIARRLLVTASEDVGPADPTAFLLAGQAFRAVEVLGMPECRIPLSQATLHVARAPKSNEAITAVDSAAELLRSRPLDAIPPHLRDAHYAGAKALGHGKDYLYSHNHPEQGQDFLPKALLGQRFTVPPKREVIDQDAMARLQQQLRERHGDTDWFELDAEALAAELGWPAARVRMALNQLVKSKKIAFKRAFKVHSPEKGQDAEAAE